MNGALCDLRRAALGRGEKWTQNLRQLGPAELAGSPGAVRQGAQTDSGPLVVLAAARRLLVVRASAFRALVFRALVVLVLGHGSGEPAASG